MKITDKNGFDIEVDDLERAIVQADNFRQLGHADEQFKDGDEIRQAYWQDIYENLLRLKPSAK